MATDFLVYWMMQPSGLFLIGWAVVIPFIFWRLVLSEAFAGVGFTPLLVGYVCAAVGLVVDNFAWSYLEFSGRVTKGVLQEAQRWSILPGWTFYLTVISLIYVLALLGIFGAPLTALAIRMRKLTFQNIAAAAAALWIALALFALASPSNEWHRIHRLESFVFWLKQLHRISPVRTALLGAGVCGSLRADLRQRGMWMCPQMRSWAQMAGGEPTSGGRRH